LENHFTIGPAILWSPFLLVAHGCVLVARAFGSSVTADGFSAPYRFAMAFGTALYGFLGLLIAFRLSKKYVEERWALLATLAVWWGSSLAIYIYFNPSWSHAHSAFAVALFVWYWLKTREHRTTPQWILLGAIAGLMLNVYYANAMLLILVAAEALLVLRDVIQSGRSAEIPGLLPRYALFTIALLICLLPTLISKRIVYGSPFESGYIPIQLWYWKSPFFLQVLFSANHGLFSWTPLLFFLWQRGPVTGQTKSSLEPVAHPARAGRDAGSARATDHDDALAAGNTRKEAWFRGARFGMVATCVLMSLLPNGSPRYLYPLFLVPCLLLAQVLIGPDARERVPTTQSTIGERALKLWRMVNRFLLILAGAAIVSVPLLTRMNLVNWIGLLACALLWFFGWIVSRADPGDFSGHLLQQAVTTATVLMIAMLAYAIAIVPRVNSLSYGAREVADSIRVKLPQNAILWVHENEYRPFWYYLEPQARYFLSAEELPPDARYVILPKQLSARFTQNPRWKNARFQTLSEIVDNEKKEFVLLEKRPEMTNDK